MNWWALPAGGTGSSSAFSDPGSTRRVARESALPAESPFGGPIDPTLGRTTPFPPSTRKPGSPPASILENAFGGDDFKWGEQRDLNPRPPDPQSGALPAELCSPRNEPKPANRPRTRERNSTGRGGQIQAAGRGDAARGARRCGIASSGGRSRRERRTQPLPLFGCAPCVGRSRGQVEKLVRPEGLEPPTV